MSHSAFNCVQCGQDNIVQQVHDFFTVYIFCTYEEPEMFKPSLILVRIRHYLSAFATFKSSSLLSIDNVGFKSKEMSRQSGYNDIFISMLIID